MLQAFPAELVTWTGQVAELERPPQGGYYDVTIVTGERGRFVLKAGLSADRVAELHEECRVLAELHEQATFVPQPVAHVVTGGTGLFLFTCVEGTNLLAALEDASDAERHVLMQGLGRALRFVHSWQPLSRRPTDWLGEALAAAARNIATGAAANPVDHSGEFHGQDADAVLRHAQGSLAEVPVDLVYGHGDFCLPNALADGGRIAGVIDWSRGGYTDRRIDLASGVWSIRHNLRDEPYVASFLEAYGYTDGAASLRPFEALSVLL